MALRVAAAQTVPVPGDVSANLSEHVRLIGEARERGADVVVFPELSLTGYELGLARQLAFSQGDERLDALRLPGITVVVGAPVRVADTLHVGALILGADSTELYTKRRLGAFSEAAAVDGVVPPPESSVFDAGTLDPLVRDTAALAICADVGDPAHAARAAARGASIYLASMFVIPSELAEERRRLSAIAATHRMAVVQANYGGPTGGLASGGCSAIWSREGILIDELGPAGSGLVVADL